jgi:hypothetical protein
MIITQPECVFVALGIQSGMRMRHIVICGLPRTRKFYNIISQRHDFREKKVLNIKRVF